MRPQPSSVANVDGRPDSCVSLAFQHLGIEQDLIEALQSRTSFDSIPYPLWLYVIEICSRLQLERYEWQGTLPNFIEQHQEGKFLAIVEVTNEEDVSERSTHAVAVIDGAAYNIKNTDRPVFRIFKVKS